MTGTEEVAGATVEVYKASDINADGSIKNDAAAITSWVSVEGAKHDFGDKLTAGESYVIIETNAPTGYAYTANIPFAVEKDGTITVDSSVKAEDGTILVKDEAIVISLNKTDITGTSEVAGATIKVYKASDINEDGNVKENQCTNRLCIYSKYSICSRKRRHNHSRQQRESRRRYNLS